MSRMFSGCSALATISSNTAWQCPQSEEMFAGCTQLKGAVAYDENKTDVKMANPETGYFTRSNDGGVEAYVAQSADKTTLTFYYDDQRATRTDTTWGIEETKKEGMTPSLHGQEHGKWQTVPPRVWCSIRRSEISVPPPLPGGSAFIVRSSRSKGWNTSTHKTSPTCMRCSRVALV